MGTIARFHNDDKDIHFTHKVDETFQDVSYGIHNRWELIFVKSGDLTYMVGGKSYRVGKNWLIITRPFDGHRIGINQSVPYERYVINFSQEIITGDICKTFPAGVDVLDCNGNELLRGLFAKMEQYIPVFDRDTLTVLFSHLIEEIMCNAKVLAENAGRESETAENPVVAQAIRYIKSNICRPLAVEEVAAYLHISYSYLNRLFLRYLQVSPKQFILSHKLIFAFKDLCEGEKPVEVSEKYGFTDYAGFYRHYTKYFGHKPSEAAAHKDTFNKED